MLDLIHELWMMGLFKIFKKAQYKKGFVFFNMNINFTAVRRHRIQFNICSELSIQFRTTGTVTQTRNCRSLSDQCQQRVAKRVTVYVSALQ